MALSLRPELKNFDKAKRERRKRRELTEDQKNEIREAFDLFDADKGKTRWIRLCMVIPLNKIHVFFSRVHATQ